VVDAGHRETKKRRTRATIATHADGLFATHGYDAVTVTDVARAAGVAPATVFNYFGTKEQLFFDRADGLREAMLAAVRERPAGCPVAAAFRQWHEGALHLLTDARAREPVARFAQNIRDSDALQRHQAALYRHYEEDLAALIPAGHPDDPTPSLLAAQLVTVHRQVVALALRLARSGRSADECDAAVRAATEAGFEPLSSRALGRG